MEIEANKKIFRHCLAILQLEKKKKKNNNNKKNDEDFINTLRSLPFPSQMKKK